MWEAKPPWMSLPGMTWARQIVPCPEVQSSQVPQGITAGTITARPTHCPAALPAPTTRPLIS